MKREIKKELNRVSPEKAVVSELERSVDRLDEVIGKIDSIGQKIDSIELPKEIEISNFPTPEPYSRTVATK